MLLNASYQTKIGKLTGFGYLLEFDPIVGVPAAAGDSTSTYGLRFAGEAPAGKVKIGYLASWATQTDAGENPLSFDLDYVTWPNSPRRYKQFGLGRRHGNPRRQRREGIYHAAGDAAQVPGLGGQVPDHAGEWHRGHLRECHRQPEGHRRPRHSRHGAELPRLPGRRSISADYGSEWNASIAAKFKKLGFMLKYADYQEGVLASARDTEKLWVQMEFIW